MKPWVSGAHGLQPWVHIKIAKTITLYGIIFGAFFRYDIIAKTETTAEDTACLEEVMGITNNLKRGPGAIHGFTMNAGKIGKSENLVVRAFQTLTKTQVKKLVEIYYWDFEAFEYEYHGSESLAIDL